MKLYMTENNGKETTMDKKQFNATLTVLADAQRALYGVPMTRNTALLLEALIQSYSQLLEYGYAEGFIEREFDR